jgi:N-methylhydantoinase A
VRTRVTPADPDAADAIEAVFAELEEQCRDELGAEGATSVARSIDARFRGQAHQLTVPLDDGVIVPAALPGLVARFREHYRSTYGVDLDAPVELVNFRVRLTRRVEKPPAAPTLTAGTELRTSLIGSRPAHFAEVGALQDTPVHSGSLLVAGQVLEGPCLVDGADTTVVVPPTHVATVDPRGDLVLRRLGTEGRPG